MEDFSEGKRRILINGGLIFTGVALAKTGSFAFQMKHGEKSKETEEAPVTPNEDLMREHGLLSRLLLIYKDAIVRINNNAELPNLPLYDATMIIRKFIQDYHEMLEEDYLFKRFEKNHIETQLVDTLHKQHDKGREVVDKILSLTKNNVKSAKDKQALLDRMQAFIRMYEPHAAREDTILYPAFKKLISKDEYYDLGEEFEKREEKLFGKDGYYQMIDQVAGIEKLYGIYELDQFTPKT